MDQSTATIISQFINTFGVIIATVLSGIIGVFFTSLYHKWQKKKLDKHSYFSKSDYYIESLITSLSFHGARQFFPIMLKAEFKIYREEIKKFVQCHMNKSLPFDSLDDCVNSFVTEARRKIKIRWSSLQVPDLLITKYTDALAIVDEFQDINIPEYTKVANKSKDEIIDDILNLFLATMNSRMALALKEMKDMNGEITKIKSIPKIDIKDV